jgi:formylglycine-generating enzyme required for sulfatase activity
MFLNKGMFGVKNITLVFSVSFLLTGCDAGNSAEPEQSAKQLADKSVANMVAIKGGEFLMGDFGPLVGEKLPFSINQDDKKLHKVILSDFFISKYKITNADYGVYLKSESKEDLPKGPFMKSHPSLLKDDYSVSVTWEQAKKYCEWLGEEIGKKLDLPTEAQWEYAARSRGEYIPYATDDGNFKPGYNVPDNLKMAEYTDGLGLPFYPIGKYPPNKLGLYDMGLSGSEWTNDWYSADYYFSSPVNDPKGPEKGTEKVLRGYVGGDRQYALTMFRQSALPIPLADPDDNYKKVGIGPQYVFRCVMNN